MRTIEYKKFISNNNVTYKGSKTSVIDIYKHAQKYLTEMDMNDSFNKKIAHMYLVNLSKKEKLNKKEKTWLINYIAITESLEHDIDFNILRTRTIKMPGFHIIIGDGIDFKSNRELTLGYMEETQNKIAINLSNIEELNEELTGYEFFEIASTCYHEITHAIQKNSIKEQKYPDYETWMLANENILLASDSNYYNDNYERNLTEAQARYMERKKALSLLYKCNRDKYKEILPMVRKEYQSDKAVADVLITEENVMFDLGEVTSTKIMDRYVSSTSHILSEYPILRFIYTKDGKPKEINDLIKDEQTCLELYNRIYKDEPNKVEKTKEFYDKLLWTRIRLGFDVENKDEERVKEAINNNLETLKNKLKCNKKVISDYDRRKNELVLKKNIGLCEHELIKLNDKEKSI